MDQCLRNRATEVRHPGVYLGFLEWVAFAHLYNRRVLMLFGTSIVDVMAVFAPGMDYAKPAQPVSDAHVACVKIGLNGALLAAHGHPQVNHFVIGIPGPRFEYIAAGANTNPGDVALCAHEAAKCAGWSLKATIAQGDCGVDAMCWCLGYLQDHEARAAMRKRIASFLTEVANDDVWQEIAKACQEDDEPVSDTGPGQHSRTEWSSVLGESLPPLPPPSSAPEVCRDYLPLVASNAVETAGVILQSDEVSAMALAPPSEAVEVAPQSIAPASSPKAVSGSREYRRWLSELPSVQLDEVTSSMCKLKEAEHAMWQSKPKRRSSSLRPKRRCTSTLLGHRMETAEAYAEWMATEGRTSSAPLRDYLRMRHPEYKQHVPKKVKQWLHRAHKEWTECRRANAGLRACTVRGRRTRYEVPNRLLRRQRGTQGRPFLCPVVREVLWDWFVDVRSSVAGIMTSKIVLAKAEEIAAKILKISRASGAYLQMPKLDRMWLLRFKRDYGVVLRKPNARFKCTRPVLLSRVRAMWLNTYKVRHLATKCLGHDLHDKIFGIDEKPLHFNEGGSKNIGTLEIAGVPSVRLKQNHAATRERVSLMTMVTSSSELAGDASNIPLELLVRGLSSQRLRLCHPPADLKVSAQWAEKGSYRNEHIQRYLKRWLEPWTELRAQQQDWRILMLDCATSHLGDALVNLCHERGYVLLYHYAHTTGVAQVNDTDLHGEFSRRYIELEAQQFHRQQLVDPSDISRSVVDVFHDACAVWRRCNHAFGARGHLSNGLSNALDGSEDALITRVAGELWRELDMATLRAQAIADVDAMLDSGAITSFHEWDKLIEHPPDPGINQMSQEGMEFEGELGPGECPWLTDADKAAIMHDSVAVMTEDLQIAPAPVAEAARLDLASARRLALLRELRVSCVNARVPGAVGLADQHIRRVERSLNAGGSAQSQEANAIVAKLLRTKLDKERLLAKKRSASARKAKRADRRNLLMKRRLKAAQAAKAAAKRELKRKIEALPAHFTDLMVDTKDKVGQKARVDCLERLKSRSPALPFMLEVHWYRIKRHWSTPKHFLAFMGLNPKHIIGPPFIRCVLDCQRALVEHYQGETQFNSKGQTGGNARAFELLCARIYRAATPKMKQVEIIMK